MWTESKLNHFIPLILLKDYQFRNQVKELKRSHSNDTGPAQFKVFFVPTTKKPKLSVSKSSVPPQPMKRQPSTNQNKRKFHSF